MFNLNIKLKRFFVLLLILSSLLLTGCYDYHEISDLSIVLGVAIDKNDDNTFTLTMEVVSFSSNDNSSSSNETGSSKSVIVETTDDTIYEAINNSSNIIGKRTYWDHAKVIILSNKLDENDFKRVLDCFMRNNDTNVHTKLFVAQTERASDIFDATSSFYSYISEDIISTTEVNSNLSLNYTIDLYEIIDYYGYTGSSIALPSINLVRNNDKASIALTGIGLFNKESFVGFLSDEDTMFHLFALDKIRYGEFSIKTNDIEEDNANISFKILNSKTNISPKIVNNKFEVDYDIKVNLVVSGYAGKQNFKTDKDILILSRLASQYLEDNIENYLGRLQNIYETDVLFLTKKFKGKYPDKWQLVKENWPNVFKNIKFNVNVNCDVINTGAISSIIKES